MLVEMVAPATRPPLYEQLQSELRDRIERGVYRPGDLFPSEAELMAEHSVSRITVRRAIAELQREGLVTTRQGAGTYVSDPSRAGAQCLLSFTSVVLREGRKPGARLLSMAVERGPADIVAQLRLSPETEVVHIKRLRTVDGEPVFLSDAYVPASVLPGIACDDLATSGLDQSLYRLIERHHPVPLDDGEEVATAVIANEEVRQIFALPRHSPVIRNTCLLRDRNGSPIIYEEATWGVPQHSTVIWRRSFAAVQEVGNKA